MMEQGALQVKGNAPPPQILQGIWYGSVRWGSNSGAPFILRGFFYFLYVPPPSYIFMVHQMWKRFLSFNTSEGEGVTYKRLLWFSKVAANIWSPLPDPYKSPLHPPGTTDVGKGSLPLNTGIRYLARARVSLQGQPPPHITMHIAW